MACKKNQAYTEEFRREAVKRSEQPGVTQAQVANELGISAQQIANWKRHFSRLSDKQFNSMVNVSDNLLWRNFKANAAIKNGHRISPISG